jgi:RNA polymerase sigma factor (sigma-70 family)
MTDDRAFAKETQGLMAHLATGSIVQQIESLFEGNSVAGLTDRELLERFIVRRDPAGEAAFAALVTRHGPMVLDVCLSIMGDLHHAEDAFQAVFLVLARRAGSIRNPDLLGNWLYGVAIRTARCAKHQLDRQRKREGGAMRRLGSESSMVVESIDREDMEALHDEIARLPGPFRLPVVLCYFEGLTLDEAASRLRWPAGTLRSRLARARDKLRRGLTRRGIALPAALLTTALSSRSVSARISSPLCDVTTKAAIQFAAGQAAREVVSASVAALTHEVIRSMFLTKLKLTLLILLALGAIASGGAFVSGSLAGMNDEPKQDQAGPRRPTLKADELNGAAPGRMIVTGQVLDPTGKPAVGAVIDILGRPRKPRVATRNGRDSRIVLGHGTTGTDGHFRLEASRSSWEGFFEVYALAAAPGFGLGWAVLNPDAGQPAANLQLPPEQMITGKLVDLNGEPADGIELRVGQVGRPTKAGMFDGVYLGDASPRGLGAWPRPVRSDDRGRFTLAGVGRDLTASLIVEDTRFAHQWLGVQTDGRDGQKDKTLVLEPATIIEGRVLTADTNQPIPNAAITVSAGRKEVGGWYTTNFLSDDQGRFTVNPSPGAYFRMSAFPAKDQPYLVPEYQFAWTKGSVKKMMDIKLPRGVLIQGKVIEQGIGRPVEGATVQYLAARNPDHVLDGWQGVVVSEDDGSFQIVVSPGQGHLFVYGPTSDYILETIGDRVVHQGQPGGSRYYAHDIIPYEVKAGDRPHEMTAVLRPGKTIKGRLIGPEGQPIDKAEIITTLFFQYIHLNWRGDLTIHARDSSFVLRGLDPDKTARVSILDADHEWGTTVELSGNQAGEDMTIRLQPCGQAKARFVNPDGKPVVKFFPHFEILGTPGPTAYGRSAKDRAELTADATLTVNVDRKHYGRQTARTDAEGRIILPDLIPGACYRILDFSTINVQGKGAQVRKDFTIKPGETLDLGDILIEKPQE